MNGFLLLIPFLLIRFGLLASLDQSAVKRAAHFPPDFQAQTLVYWSYQLSTTGIFVCSCFLSIAVERTPRFYSGLFVYSLGLLLCAASMIAFSAPSRHGFHQNGLYRISRNPMYVSYFICFMGCALLTRSAILCGIVLLFQISGHWLILAEEQWCLSEFGEAYRQYMCQVKRYI